MKMVNNNTYCLKVYFHVIRRSNGTGGQTTNSVNAAFNILNQDFNPHGIFFNWDNNIDYIDSDTYFSTPMVSIYNVNNHQDGIDIYLFDDSANAGGRANGVGQSSEFWVSGKYWKSPYNSLTTSHVISHEMGHVLYLWHTHHGTYNEGGNDNPCPELVNGTNSSTCGDYVEDTPADPHLHFDVNQSTCQWNSSGADSNGDFYNPDEKLIMSYTDLSCMEYFSPKQGARMRNAIATLSYLQQTSGIPKPNGFISVLVDPWLGRIKASVEALPNATGYIWYLDGIQQIGPGMNNAFVTMQIARNDCNTRDYIIGVKAITPCGTSSQYYELHENPCYQGYYYSFAPNPTTETLTIIRNGLNKLNNEINYLINKNHKFELYDFNAYLILQGKLSKKTVIDVSSLIKGRYILKIHIDEDVQENHHIIIN